MNMNQSQGQQSQQKQEQQHHQQQQQQTTTKTATPNAAPATGNAGGGGFVGKGFFNSLKPTNWNNVIPIHIQNLAVRKYTLPDKSVASQVLMYRQLLHTKCRPGLKLSRDYQATPAQIAVMHMPWWEQGIETSRKMVISYDNLIVRLWTSGIMEPYLQEQQQEKSLLSEGAATIEATAPTLSDTINSDPESLLLDSKTGLPPVPHKFWVEKLGFQQNDPVTDFRSGGVLSLAMMVHMVETCPLIVARFRQRPVNVLPFGITCINVTDMLAKFCMFSKSVDRMDALLSQKPFWRMFADPNAILALQELSMHMLCNVVEEIQQEKQIKDDENVTVFDFSSILERTEKRVRDDLLGAGPKTVDELRAIAKRLDIQYERKLERKLEEYRNSKNNANSRNGTTTSSSSNNCSVGAVVPDPTSLAIDFANATTNLASKNASQIANNIPDFLGMSSPTGSATTTNTPETTTTSAGVAANNLTASASKIANNASSIAADVFASVGCSGDNTFSNSSDAENSTPDFLGIEVDHFNNANVTQDLINGTDPTSEGDWMGVSKGAMMSGFEEPIITTNGAANSVSDAKTTNTNGTSTPTIFSIDDKEDML